MTENHDNIVESRMSRWAYRLALIPILGLPLYIVLAILAVIRIGSKGQTGFHLLRLGLFRMLRMTIVGILGCAALWFCPIFYSWGDSFEYDEYSAWLIRYNLNSNEYISLSGTHYRKDGCVGTGNFDSTFKIFPNGYEINTALKTEHWIYKYSNGRVQSTVNYVNGAKSGEWEQYYLNGQLQWKGNYDYDLQQGIGEYYDDSGTKQTDKFYCNGKVVKTIEIKDGDKIVKWTDWYKEKLNFKEKYDYKVTEDNPFFGRTLNINYAGASGDGKWVMFRKDKTRIYEGNFNKSNMSGSLFTFSPNEEIIKEELYNEDGTLIKTINFKDGKPIEEKTVDDLEYGAVKGDDNE